MTVCRILLLSLFDFTVMLFIRLACIISSLVPYANVTVSLSVIIVSGRYSMILYDNELGYLCVMNVSSMASEAIGMP